MNRSVFAALVAVCLPVAASAVYLETFDAYAPGSQLHGQGGWIGWGGDPGAGALVSNAQSLSAGNSVAVTGATDVTHWFSGYTSGQFRISGWQYIPSSSTTGTTYWIWLNIGEANWSIQTWFDLSDGIVMSDYGTSATLPIVRDQWVELSAVVDLDANTVSEYYNGTLLTVHAWQVGGAAAIAQVDLYANGAHVVYYDNIAISLIPEPAALSLLALGALALARRRR
jgi:hypothetical protein